jgi:hypothetical protein
MMHGRFKLELVEFKEGGAASEIMSVEELFELT